MEEIFKPICIKCGSEVTIYSDDPAKTVCENCCTLINDFHKYEYDKWRRGKFCIHCEKEKEPE